MVAEGTALGVAVFGEQAQRQAKDPASAII
jgi:hypothetical protein